MMMNRLVEDETFFEGLWGKKGNEQEAEAAEVVEGERRRASSLPEPLLEPQVKVE